MKYNIAFFCHSIPFTDESIRLKTSLGGSETALIQVANALAARGNTVKIFTTIPDPAHARNYSGVDWYDVSVMPSICKSIEHDIFISLRSVDAMSYPVRAKYRAMWCQDELLNGEAFYGHLWQTDEIIYVSDWQREHYESQLPDNAKDMAFVTKNGIDLGLIDDAIRGVSKGPNKLIYISRPERGLLPLLDAFPKIREKFPDLYLKVCRYYSMYEPNPNVKAICDEADRRVEETEGVTFLGNLNKTDLYKEIASSKLMLYPGVINFNETSCIAALESQACRTPLICSNRGGLKETLQDRAGIKIDGDPYSSEYQEEFIQAIGNYLNPHSPIYESDQMNGRNWVEANYQYKDIAGEWEQHFDTYFENRLENNSVGVYKNLFHHDDMVAAQLVANRFGFGDEARDAIAAASEDESPEEYAKHALDPQLEYTSGGRNEIITDFLSDLNPKKILDFACGNGSMLRTFYEMFPDADEIIGIDYSPELCEIASAYNKPAPKIKVQCGSFGQIPHDDYDLIFCGEFLEHNTDYTDVIDTLESNLAPGGWLVWTLPTGPMCEMMSPSSKLVRNHKLHWEDSTISEVFGFKPGYACIRLSMPASERGNTIGHWIIRHQAGTTGTIDYRKKIATTRPYQTLSACIITRNSADDLPRMMRSIWNICDEIIIGDQGSTDGTIDIAKMYNGTILPLPDKAPIAPEWTPNPGSFEWMRNKTVEAAQGDWILWLDTDEELLRADLVRRYLDSPAYEGYAIRQNHLMLDREARHDLPIRLFRNHRGYKFYGHIHEQNMKTLNEPITPALELPTVDIAHYGYVTEYDRRQKSELRNLPLLVFDRQAHPDRKLGQVLLAREYLNAIAWDIGDEISQLDDRGRLPKTAERTVKYAEMILEVYREFFGDMTHDNFDLMWPIYQAALKYLGRGVPMSLNVSMNGEASQVFRFENKDDLQMYLNREVERETESWLVRQ